jgi:two-component system chemotaxis response regulator CheB
MSALVAGLPPTFPIPVLVAQHRPGSADPGRLPWLLGRRAALPVRSARPGMAASAPGVTLIPGGRAAVVDPAGQLRLAVSREPAGDALLASAAETASHGAVIAVVLSGMLRGGGAEGVRAVKRHGGRVLAQDPATAEAPGMPASAIATGCVDFVLAPDRLAIALVALAMAPGGAELLTVPLPHWAKIGA